MKTNKFGEIVLSEQDISDLTMQGREPWNIANVLVEDTVNLEHLVHIVEDPGQMITWTFPTGENIAVPDYDEIKQREWFMPDEYKNMDVAAHILGLCKTDAELQRVGQELLMFQERNLFDLLRYLKYLVDTLHKHRIIWGVGRGSSVASYVLYLLGIHKIDSMFYDLDPAEFLR